MLKKYAVILSLIGTCILASNNNSSDQSKSDVTKSKLQQKVTQEVANSKQAKAVVAHKPPITSIAVVRNGRFPEHYKNLFVSDTGDILGSYEVRYQGVVMDDD